MTSKNININELISRRIKNGHKMSDEEFKQNYPFVYMDLIDGEFDE